MSRQTVHKLLWVLSSCLHMIFFFLWWIKGPMYELSFCTCQIWRKMIINDGDDYKTKENVSFPLYPVSLFHSFHLFHPLLYFSIAFSLLLLHLPVPHSLWTCPKCHIYYVSVSASALHQSNYSSISSHTPLTSCKKKGDSLSTNRFLCPPLWGSHTRARTLTTTSALNTQPIMCSLLTHTLIHLKWAVPPTPPQGRQQQLFCSQRWSENARVHGSPLRQAGDSPLTYNMMLSELHETPVGSNGGATQASVRCLYPVQPGISLPKL